MENLLAALRAVYPLLTMLALGMLVRRLKLVTDNGLREMNGLIYKLFFPMMMFANVLDSDFSAGADWRLVATAVVLIVTVFVALMLLVPRFEKQNARRGVLVQGIFRSELLVALMAVFGGPCATASCAMAQQMGGDGDLAALLVVFTSLLCVVTFFLWIYALKALGLA